MSPKASLALRKICWYFSILVGFWISLLFNPSRSVHSRKLYRIKFLFPSFFVVKITIKKQGVKIKILVNFFSPSGIAAERFNTFFRFCTEWTNTCLKSTTKTEKQHPYCFSVFIVGFGQVLVHLWYLRLFHVLTKFNPW